MLLTWHVVCIAGEIFFVFFFLIASLIDLTEGEVHKLAQKYIANISSIRYDIYGIFITYGFLKNINSFSGRQTRGNN